MSLGLRLAKDVDLDAAVSSGEAAGRIGVLFLNSPGVINADAQIHLHLMRELDRSRFDVHAACFEGPGQTSESFRTLAAVPGLHLRNTQFGPSASHVTGFQKATLPLAMAPTLASLAGLALYIRRHHIKIIHASSRPRDAIPCVLLGRLTGAKSVIHIHVASQDWISRPVRWAMTNADALFSISNAVTETLLETGYPAGKIHTLLNSIELTAWDCNLNQQTMRAELGLPLNAPIIVSIARLFPSKGQAELIRALRLVRQQIPDVRLLIVGSDDVAASGGRSYSAELKALVSELGLQDNVTFLGQRRDIARLLAASDVFSLPSFWEPFGLVFLEAMAMKRPVVALDNGGTPEVVDHGETGLLSPPEDIEALTANLVTLLRDPALRARMGERGRKTVEERFTSQRMAGDAALLYENLLNQAKEAP